jgi:transcription antitermination factor NusG
VEKENDIVWFAMSAPYRRELIAKEYLSKKEVECFVPMKEALVERQGGIKRRQMVPAIHNLIFVHTSKERIKTLKQGVNFLQYHTRPQNGKNIPITVPDSQMQQFIDITNAANADITYLRPEEVDIKKGTKVRVHGGAFDGTEGYFVKVQGKRSRRVVLLIEGVTAVALTEISTDFIEVIAPQSPITATQNIFK